MAPFISLLVGTITIHVFTPLAKDYVSLEVKSGDLANRSQLSSFNLTRRAPTDIRIAIRRVVPIPVPRRIVATIGTVSANSRNPMKSLRYLYPTAQNFTKFFDFLLDVCRCLWIDVFFITSDAYKRQ